MILQNMNKEIPKKQKRIPVHSKTKPEFFFHSVMLSDVPLHIPPADDYGSLPHRPAW